MPDARSPLARWALDPEVVHLNHGSFGGCLRSVLEAAAGWRTRIEAAPMRFFVLEWQDAIDAARDALAQFVGAPADRLVFVPGATTGVAIALSSMADALAPGDEIVTTDHAYRACKNQLARLADRRGVAIVVAKLAVPYDPDQAVDEITRAVTPRTKLALLDHVTSPTALVLPLDRLVPMLEGRGVRTIIDGAHAPGQLELDVAALGATYYTGNCHKWMCAPKGSGFLYAALGAPVVPLVTSHGASAEYGPANRLHAELDWAGTHDPAPYLAVPAAIDDTATEGGDWPAIRAGNHALVVELRRRLLDGRAAMAPDASLGAMAAIPIDLPAGVAPLQLERELLTAGWEVPIVDFATGPLVRVSAHLYNHAEQADALARELHARGVRLR
ncbi:MAG TPA: aminotransferase class V-fold PLP-dependent enzyme [Kofleriaceae bacterium]|nr:aminotransferase class V-fold PLP-dependent enzyme [Kofleriaceae bacterium]